MKLTFLILLFSSITFSKQYQLTGKLLDSDSNPLMSASIALKSKADSSIVSGATTDNLGLFLINANEGNYYLDISYVGYERRIINVNLNRSFDIGKIILEVSSLTTEDVIVEAERQYMELDLDKRVFNVSQDKTNQGRSVSEILDNLPSVQVDVDGAVSLRGSQNVRILIDGKESGMIGRDPEQLSQIMGDLVDKVEVVTNPSARYDAQGEAGIINIVFKKKREKGFGANFDVKAGNPDNHGLAINTNYRKDFYNLFGSIGTTWRRAPGFGDTYQEFLTEDRDFAYSRTDRNQERGGLGANLRLGSDFFLNPKHILTFAFVYQYGDRQNEADLTYTDFFADNSIYQIQRRTDEEAEEKNDVEFEFDYSGEFDSKEHTLKFAAKFFQDKDVEISSLNQFNLQGIGEDIIQRSYNLEFEQNQLYQLDYVLPFGNKGKFEAGGKAQLRVIDNDFNVRNLEDDEWVFTAGFNDNFVYNENIYASYLMIGEKFSKVSAQAGLRAELSDIETQLLKSGYVYPRFYLDFFPSLNLGYELFDFNTLQFSYARRIQRPRFRSLMPFSSFTDPRNFYQGNPDLNPEYTDSYELGFLKDWEKGSLLTSLFYRNSVGVIQRVTRLDSVGFSTIQPENIGTRNNWGVELNLSIEALDSWDINANTNIFRQIIDGNSEVANLDADAFTWTAQITSKHDLFYGINFQFNINYNAPQEIPQGRIREIWWVDFAASKDILDNTASFTLSGRDVFSTRMRRMTMQDPTFFFDQDFQWRAGVVTLTFNYRINAKKSKSNFADEG